MTKQDRRIEGYKLTDRNALTEGRVFLTGTQALIRIMLDQARRDRAAGLRTAGFISGYRGSPLGGVDQELWRLKSRLAEDRIEFLPAVNEDLGATAVLGAQQAALDPAAEVEGVFSMWYGKGPGVDRSGDALKHGNAFGSHPKGGVLVVAGDDHGCVSSSMPHQSDVAFMSWFVPTLNPASVGEYLEFGEYGIALSRFSGLWVGFKAISETVESGQSIDLKPDRTFSHPPIDVPPGGLHIRPLEMPSTEIEVRMVAKLAALHAFVEANPIDRRIYDIPDARYGIVTTGKAHLDLMEALRLLGLDEAACRRLGIDIYKVGLVWPLARRDALDFVSGKDEVLVVEEKRGIIESQFKEHFYDWPGAKPQRMVGKHDETGADLLPWTGEFSPLKLVPVLAKRLAPFFPDENLPARARALTENPTPVLNVPGATRTPYFCSGCPHNSSTKVPDGSVAMSGIGCHVMAASMNRNTLGYAQMGGEGVTWSAGSRFVAGKPHRFQNLGEGTWYHSGSLGVRQAVAAGANITFKILFNDAVAMTGGQPVDGPISPQAIAMSCRAEGIERIAVVSDDVTKFNPSDFPAFTTFNDRADLDTVQREMREVPGVSILIYEQTCATEKRRRRKRGKMQDPDTFAFINDLVCEGCGDCSVESNCLSVEPKETAFGRKRKINQSSCNKDYSCLNGFCPSFVTVKGATRKKPRPISIDLDALKTDLPRPTSADLSTPYNLLVAGVGGTGVVTVGALISMAAHLEGKGSSVLDFTGFAQKFGTVLGYVRIAATPDQINQVRIEERAADGVIGCDAVVCASPKASAHYRPGTRVVLNRAEMPTGDLVLHRDADLKIDARERLIGRTVGAENMLAFDANRVSEKLMGDSVFANIMAMGAAFQQGMVPVSEVALKQAILLNGVAVDKNAMAFDLGRVLAARPQALAEYLDETPKAAETAQDLIDARAAFLEDYQNRAYADRYRARLDRFQSALPADAGDAPVISAARSLFKLMAYKDEYEVARLMTSTGFARELHDTFEGDFAVNYHFAPPLLNTGQDARGRPLKKTFGPWMQKPLKMLARMKTLRGSAFDPFSYTEDRKLDRALLDWFERVLTRVEQTYAADPQAARALLAMPMDIRGYGPVRHAAAEKIMTDSGF
ncbi:indolepyruvate ferredoxin oxidoreductase family protein [Chachezhania sediminis]|uniref:indolepyruvate ferredoxin oxidoreductase family protein n=1 Tax=Chachezhania sediminis TaxID=2599291 RepID=UPI00131D82DC|nr:indolepyruvate ferredoxin oxidoreductase family protein [Chachezhania sediminis]